MLGFGCVETLDGLGSEEEEEGVEEEEVEGMQRWWGEGMLDACAAER